MKHEACFGVSKSPVWISFLKDDDSLITKDYMEARRHLCQMDSGAGLCFILSYFFF